MPRGLDRGFGVGGREVMLNPEEAVDMKRTTVENGRSMAWASCFICRDQNAVALY